MSSVLVLGANSFSGLALIPELLSQGMAVHAVSRSSLNIPPHPDLFLYKGSMGDSRLLRRILPKCEKVFHLASSSTPGVSSRHPVIEGTQNILPTLRFIEAAQSFPDLHIIYVSSGGAIYGNTEIPRVIEDDKTNPISYYGAGKASIEIFFHTLHNNTGNKLTVVRPSNLYGPGQHFRKSFGLIRTLLEHIINDRNIEIWGDGSSVRDYLYIDDYIEACLKIVNSKDKTSADTYNIGSNKGHSINEIIHVIENVVGKKLKTVYRPGRSSDVNSIILDTTRFCNQYNWAPATDLRTGITRTWEWLKKQ